MLSLSIRKLNVGETILLADLNKVFAEAFNDFKNYQSQKPSLKYLESLLQSETFICIVALDDNRVVGGLTAYILPKAEQERKEVYIYDIAVDNKYRRQGVASNLIQALKKVAILQEIQTIYVQADKTDAPAIALYNKIGIQREVYHFDINTEIVK